MDRKNGGLKMKKGNYFSVITFLTVLICLTFLINSAINQFSKRPEPFVKYDTVTNETLLNEINNGEVIKVVIEGSTAYYKTENGNYKVNDYNTELTPLLELNELTEVQQVVETSTGLSPMTVFFIVIGSIGLLISLVMFGISKATDSAMKTISEMQQHERGGKANGDVMTERPKVTFDDVSGCDELKASVKNDIECLKNPSLLTEMGARMPKGIVLYGPPGTGKTLIAKAIAGSAGVNFISASGSDFIEMYVGVGAQRIRKLYDKARKCAPCIVFIDEIDAIGGQRGMAQNSERDQTINALLTELDGFGGKEGILTICATNRLDMLDPALIRPGRFDKQLAVPLPDRKGRFEILSKYAKNKKLTEDVSIDNLAEKTIGFSGAELEAILTEAALIAISKKQKYINYADVEDAFFQVVMKGNKKKNDKEASDYKLIAYHEAGHALATKLLTDDDVPTVTIVGSTSGAGGVTFRSPKEKVVQSKKYLRNLIKVMYAGRAAESIYLEDDDEITTGASQDIKQATNLIKNYIGTYGMGQNGMLALDQFNNSDEVTLEEASKMANKLYGETVQLLGENRSLLDAIAARLIEKESINGEELDSIINPPVMNVSFDEPVEKGAEGEV